MPAGAKIVAVFAVALAGTASAYFFLIPDDPVQPPTPADVDQNAPPPQDEARDRPRDQGNRGQGNRDRNRDQTGGIVSEAIGHHLAAGDNGEDGAVRDEATSGEDREDREAPLIERLAGAQAATLPAGKGDVDLSPLPDELIGPPLIDQGALARAEGEHEAPATDSEQDEAPAQQAPEPTVYHVKPGDTMLSIAQQHFGDEAKWSLIAQANPDVDPRRMNVGRRLILPAKDGAGRDDPGRAIDATNTYVVRSGDTLTRIAVRLWGDPSKWRDLYEANRTAIGESPNNLKVGMKLAVPRAG